MHSYSDELMYFLSGGDIPLISNIYLSKPASFSLSIVVPFVPACTDTVLVLC